MANMGKMIKRYNAASGRAPLKAKLRAAQKAAPLKQRLDSVRADGRLQSVRGTLDRQIAKQTLQKKRTEMKNQLQTLPKQNIRGQETSVELKRVQSDSSNNTTRPALNKAPTATQATPTTRPALDKGTSSPAASNRPALDKGSAPVQGSRLPAGVVDKVQSLNKKRKTY